MRYVPWELNGFPTWLEKAYRDRPEVVSDAMLRELAWDLEREEAQRSYMLHDIAYYAPWLHAEIAEWVINWLEANNARDADVLRKAIFIASSTTDSTRLSALARAKLEVQSCIAEHAKWFAVWVDIDADEAIAHLERWLGSLTAGEASTAAQHFITELIGSSRSENLGTRFESHRASAHLKRLYVLMHQHITANTDINRALDAAFTRLACATTLRMRATAYSKRSAISRGRRHTSP